MGDRREEGTVEHHINAKKRRIRKCGVKKEKQKGKTLVGYSESQTQSNPTVREKGV